MASVGTNLAWEPWAGGRHPEAEAWIDEHDLSEFFYMASAARRLRRPAP